jgi:hypothetical protein
LPFLLASTSPSVGAGAGGVYFFELEAPSSWGVGDVGEVSAFREMGSPSWEGLVLLVLRARSRRVGFCWGC